MPQITEIVQSDEEYQDAESDVPPAPIQRTESPSTDNSRDDSNAAVVEEIIKEQCSLHLEDDDSGEKAATTDKCTTDGKVPASTPEYLHEEIDEEDLKEKEKSMTPEEIQANKEKANAVKLQANDLFKDNECEKAIDLYTDALKVCPFSCSKERAVLYGNRAAAKIKIDSKKTAIDDCSKALELWPEYVRALLRRGKLYEHEDKLDEALADYKRVVELDPSQHEAREAMVRLPPIIQERNERLKEEMLGKLKDLGNLILKPFGLSTSNFQMQQDPNSGSYSINFNQNPS